jgi:hypothetical protein
VQRALICQRAKLLVCGVPRVGARVQLRRRACRVTCNELGLFFAPIVHCARHPLDRWWTDTRQSTPRILDAQISQSGWHPAVLLASVARRQRGRRWYGSASTLTVATWPSLTRSISRFSTMASSSSACVSGTSDPQRLSRRNHTTDGVLLQCLLIRSTSKSDSHAPLFSKKILF